jgi:hypothetical protein
VAVWEGAKEVNQRQFREWPKELTSGRLGRRERSQLETMSGGSRPKKLIGGKWTVRPKE